MSDSAPDDRTEAPSARRLERARDEGHIPVSREVVAAAGLAAVTLAAILRAPAVGQGLSQRLSLFLAQLDNPQLAGPRGLVLAGSAVLAGIAPFVLAALLAGSAAVLVQTGLLVHGGAIRPVLARLSPRAGLRRLFGVEGAVEALRSAVKLAAMGIAVWLVLRAAWPTLAGLTSQDPRGLLVRAAEPALRVALAVLGVQMAVALLDLLWVRLRFLRSMRMSRAEQREEQRESDGDPRIRARIRQIRMQRARRRMLAAVPKATVVITNPTHYAVALAYDRSRHAAPRVVAKGVDAVAARIREVALAHRVPLVANPPLARVLHLVALDAEIPAEHFQAVAEIIAHVWRLNRGGRRL